MASQAATTPTDPRRHRFVGGPFDCRQPVLPRRCLLDDHMTLWVAFRRGQSIEAAIDWTDLEFGSTGGVPPESGGGMAVYTKDASELNQWVFVPRGAKRS
jgi:hypothetical protein